MLFTIVSLVLCAAGFRTSSAHLHYVVLCIAQCYEALKRGVAGGQDKAKVAEFLKLIEPIQLTQAEVLQLVNLRPSTAVEVHLVVESCDERLQPEEVDDLLQIIAQTLGPPPPRLESED